VQLAASELAVARRGTIESGPLISGTLEAARGAQVNAQLGGTVRAIGPELGERVARGALLARIDPGPLAAAAASARAQVAAQARALEVARREVERTRALVQAGAIPQREIEQAESRRAAQEAAVDQARAQLAASVDQLADATARSPIDGIVARRAVNAGDVVAPGAPLYQIIDPSSMRLSASVPSDEVAALAPGARVRFSVRGYPGEELEGTLAHVAPAADPETRQIPILVEIPNPSRRLLSGLFAQGRISTRAAAGIVIPTSAVDAASDPPSVLRVRGGVVERVPVALGLRDPLRDRVLVTRGLAEGDRILARAEAAPPPGTPVAPIPAG
jgi:RND family efflux transporter MFP subunit